MKMKKKRSTLVKDLFHLIKSPLRWFKSMNHQPSFKRIEFLNLKREFLQFEDDSGDGKKANSEIGLWYLLTEMNEYEIAELTPSEQSWVSSFINERKEIYHSYIL